jgi:hypothetical protein
LFLITIAIAGAWGFGGFLLRPLPPAAALSILAALGSFVVRWWLWAQACPNCYQGESTRPQIFDQMMWFGVYAACLALAALAAGVILGWLVNRVARALPPGQSQA